MTTEKVENSGKSGLWRPVALLLFVGVMLALSWYLELGQQLAALRDWIEGLGPWGPLVFVILYASAVVAAIPGSALTVAAGALFGSLGGVVVASVASTLGASICFLISRYLAREATAQWLGKSEKFRRLDEMTETHGAIVVALTRLVPLFPFNLLNYGFGLTRVSFATYVFWSWLCMLPTTILFVVGADAVTQGIAQGRIPWELLPILGVVAIILVFLVRLARARLQSRKATSQTAASSLKKG